MSVVSDPSRGVIADGDIRYVLIRADVLMGIARELTGKGGDFLAAFEASAFRNARDSFARYREEGRFAAGDFLQRCGEVAASLGWGRWKVSDHGAEGRSVVVEDSPFALGFGHAEAPVCAPISGVLQAMALVGYGVAVQVQEISCAAQGAQRCHFVLRPASSSASA
jgi:uncharacterized protein